MTTSGNQLQKVACVAVHSKPLHHYGSERCCLCRPASAFPSAAACGEAGEGAEIAPAAARQQPSSHRWYSQALWSFGSVQSACNKKLCSEAYVRRLRTFRFRFCSNVSVRATSRSFLAFRVLSHTLKPRWTNIVCRPSYALNEFFPYR